MEVLDTAEVAPDRRPIAVTFNLARIRWKVGETENALEGIDRVAAELERHAFPDHHPTVARARLLRATILRERGELDAARASAQAGLQGLESLQPRETSWVANARDLVRELEG